MIPMIVMTVVASLAVLLFLILRVAKGGVVGLLAKTFASLAFIALAVTGVYTLNSSAQYVIFIVFGLVCGLVGDILLDLKVVYPHDKAAYLNGGMISFGVGHGFYIAAICLYCAAKGIALTMPVLVACAVAIPMGTGIVVLGKPLLKLNYGKFFIHSLIYAIELIFTAALGLTLCIMYKGTALTVFAVGMLSFLFSDLVLSSQYFGDKKFATNKLLIIINHATYYVAQILIAVFIFLI